MRKILGTAFGAVALLASAVPAQNTVRWNDIVTSLSDDTEPPVVQVSLDRGIYRMGDPVRVSFRTEEDAFVVVARVDWNGRLTLLYPTNRRYSTAVNGGREVQIRAVRALGSFVATEQPGASGFVFALASRSPLDLSRLTQRDFSQWVTGVSWGAPTTRYIGDPYRVVQRFSRLVLYNPDAEWGFDVAFYSVDQPLYQTASMSMYCSPWDYGSRLHGWYGYSGPMSSYFDDPDGAFLSRRGSDCGALDYYRACIIGIPGMYSFIIPAACRGVSREQVVSNTPGQPVPPPVRTDSGKVVNPWAGDSVSRPWVEKAPNPVNGPLAIPFQPSRPQPGTWANNEDLSFSIPGRALRGMRGYRDEPGVPVRSPGAGGTGEGNGMVPMPGRPGPEPTTGPIEWVRPPRSIEQPTQNGIDRMPVRGGIRRGEASQPVNTPFRGREDFSPPPRANSPIFERGPEPVRAPIGARGSGDWEGPRGGYQPPMPSGYNPPAPRGYDPPGGGGRPATPPQIDGGRPAPSTPSVRTEGATPPPPPPPPPASSTGGGQKDPEKKPAP